MKTRTLKITLTIVVIILANLVGLVIATALVPPIDSQGAPRPTSPPDEIALPTHAPTEPPPGWTPDTYLPLIIGRNAPSIGVYLHYTSAIQHLLPSGHNTTGIKWSVVESTRNVYNWSSYDPIYAALDGKGRRVIQVKNSPTWARSGAYECSPPYSGYYDEFAAFIVAVIDRYDPYAVTIWNEPDADAWFPSAVGCFGPTWSNGYQYGNMVEAVYNIVKPARPNVLIGGGETAGSNTSFTNGFYYGVNGKFDVATFHFYTAYEWTNLSWLTNWANYHHSKTSKPVWLTETAFKCASWPRYCGQSDFNQKQAEYLEHLAANPDQLDLITWYHMKDDGWAQVGMVESGVRKPVWYAYQDAVGGDPYP